MTVDWQVIRLREIEKWPSVGLADRRVQTFSRSAHAIAVERVFTVSRGRRNHRVHVDQETDTTTDTRPIIRASGTDLFDAVALSTPRALQSRQLLSLLIL